MTGIAIGGLDFPKIGLGDTEVVKVSLGDVLVWPAASTELFGYAAYQGSASAINSTSCPVAYDVAGFTPLRTLMIAYNRAQSGVSVPNYAIPAGFTELYGSIGTSARIVVSWKILTPEEIDDTSITGFMSGETNSQIIVSYYNVMDSDIFPTTDYPITGVQLLSAGGQWSAGAPTSRNITPSNSGAVAGECVVTAMYGSSGTIQSGATYTGLPLDVNAFTSNGLMVIKGTTLGIGDSDSLTIGMGDGGTNNFLGECLFEILIN